MLLELIWRFYHSFTTPKAGKRLSSQRRITAHKSPFAFNSFRHVNVLQFRVTFHSGHTEVPAKAASFEASEWRLHMNAGMRIYAQDAAVHSA